jgi:hypothetical protein
MCALTNIVIPLLRPTCVGLYTVCGFINTCYRGCLCSTHSLKGFNKSMSTSTFRKSRLLAVVTVKNTFLWDFTQYYLLPSSVRFGERFCSWCRRILCHERVLYREDVCIQHVSLKRQCIFTTLYGVTSL